MKEVVNVCATLDHNNHNRGPQQRGLKLQGPNLEGNFLPIIFGPFSSTLVISIKLMSKITDEWIRTADIWSWKLPTAPQPLPRADNFATLVVSIPIGCLICKQMAYVHKHLIDLRFYIRLLVGSGPRRSKFHFLSNQFHVRLTYSVKPEISKYDRGNVFFKKLRTKFALGRKSLIILITVSQLSLVCHFVSFSFIVIWKIDQQFFHNRLVDSFIFPTYNICIT